MVTRYSKQYMKSDLENLKDQLAGINISISALNAAAEKILDAICQIEKRVEEDLKENEDTKLTEEYPVATLCKEDIMECLKISTEYASKIPDWAVQTIAKRMGDLYMEKDFWRHLDKEGRYIINDIYKKK